MASSAYTGSAVTHTNGNDAFNAALKEFYLPRLTSTINDKRVLMTRLERDTSKTDVSGRHARLPVNIRPSQAIGARADADGGPSLPTPQSQTYIELIIGYAHNYGTVRVTHPVIQASRNDRGSFIRAIGSEMDGIRRDLRNDVNRQLFGDGTGAIAACTAADDGSGVLTVSAGHKMKIGMVIEAFDAKTGGSQHDGDMTVSAVNTSGTAVTVTGTSTAVADDDYLFRKGNRGNEMMGLLGIVDDGTYASTLQGIVRATYPEWNSTVLGNSGTARGISEDLLDNALLQSEENSESEISLMITSSTQWRKIGQMMTPDRRYSTGMDLPGGFTAISWAGVPIVWDRDCPRYGQISDAAGSTDTDFLFGLDESQLAMYQLADWDFDDTDGNVLHRRQDVAAYDATLFYYGQLGTVDASKHFVIRDLSR